MSGRGQGRGRGSRNSGRSHNRRRYQQGRNHYKTKKSLSDYTYYLGNARQASDFENTTEFIMNYIKKTYSYGKDIAQALHDLEPIDTIAWRPSLQVSTIRGDDDESKAARQGETREYKMIFKEELTRYANRAQQYEENLVKAYALIWERCSAAMKNKIANRTDFNENIYDDPINLLQAIKEHALNYQEYRYQMAIIYDALRTLFYTKQKENENLQEYARRFKTAEEILQSHLGGSLLIQKAVRANPTFLNSQNDDQREQAMKECYQEFLAYVFLEQADQNKYGTLLKGLSTQHSLQNDQYP